MPIHTIAIFGSGFAGSLLALITKKIGYAPIIIEKGRHPRFAIGESSTPLANLLLDQLCTRYGLDTIRPLCKHGTWREHYPNIPHGLKRGFSFFHHPQPQGFRCSPRHSNELLVAASRDDASGDTHWFREAFDAFLAGQVAEAGIPFHDRTTVQNIEAHSGGWHIHCESEGKAFTLRADFLIDATGEGSLLTREFGLAPHPDGLLTRSWSVFSHFRSVKPWQEILAELGCSTASHPFACDDSALHQIFPHGWMWQLRFDNGICSAGFALSGELQKNTAPADQLWHAQVQASPLLMEQFSQAQRVQPFFLTRRLQRRVAQFSGDRWALMPFSGCFIDPLFSSGNAFTLLAIRRLARLLETRPPADVLHRGLQHYAENLQHEISFLDRLIHGCYQAFPYFELFTAFSMYYFAGAIISEHRMCTGEASENDGFLYSHDRNFSTAVQAAWQALCRLCEEGGGSRQERRAFQERVARDIEPINIAGLCDAQKQNMYPYI